ncbi:gag-pol fusion [Brachionus plicatilis]|uniref:Gag-pol fusion n=1 Tax=Brachionus plicatilis TaxID=10195 RepID=A0A3M7SVU8_BRAPC|nr:gag-pol fusion [Brachionus plicatilis]
MIEDIKKIVMKCSTCQRNGKPVKNYHPALATDVSNAFKRVCVDLVLGLSESDEGYVGVMIIVEFLTKYPFAKPIRKKECNLFGPFEELLSDQGKEFCNQIMDELSKNIGFNHITTSAYNPRTNGITERFNQTLIEAFRKLSEANIRKWHVYLPYVLMAYRSRIHNSTGFSPYELLFGRKMIPFTNWREDNDESQAILKRSEEIRNLIDNVHPEAA